MNEDTRGGAGGRSELRELNCEESLARVYEYLDGELDASQNDAVRRHLEKCRRCYPYFDFERMFLDYVHEVGAGEEARPGLLERVRGLLARESE
jgi:mycothiol system anti-sigma-R factor